MGNKYTLLFLPPLCRLASRFCTLGGKEFISPKLQKEFSEGKLVLEKTADDKQIKIDNISEIKDDVTMEDKRVLKQQVDKLVEEGKLNEEQVKKIEEDGILNMEK